MTVDTRMYSASVCYHCDAITIHLSGQRLTACARCNGSTRRVDTFSWCRHCSYRAEQHVGASCLFAPTVFAPILGKKVWDEAWDAAMDAYARKAAHREAHIIAFKSLRED